MVVEYSADSCCTAEITQPKVRIGQITDIYIYFFLNLELQSKFTYARVYTTYTTIYIMY